MSKKTWDRAPDERWENGVDHHQKSVNLFKQIKKIDWKYNNDNFCWKSGGDGDNGEELMYLLDMIFERKDELRIRKNNA